MEKKIVPIPIDRSEAVPTHINFRESEIGAAQTTIFEKKEKVWTEIGAIPASHLENKKKKKMAWILVGFLFLGAHSLFAEEAVNKESALKQIASVEKRGFVNFATSPAEFAYAFKAEKKDHPKAWPLTYVPRVFSNIAIRVGSSVNDLIVLPWYVAKSDATPLTRQFDLPDYVWEKE